MTLSAPTYDLVLLLDPQAEAEARAKILASLVFALPGPSAPRVPSHYSSELGNEPTDGSMPHSVASC